MIKSQTELSHVNLGLEALSQKMQSASEMRQATPSDATSGTSFSELLEKSFDQVNEQQHQADRAIQELVAGRTKNIHETMLTIERADSSLKLMTQVRNKVLDAYKEIMKMQV